MARIRTVKPEYPQHRKTRKVCRDARLLNIHLWNLADDDGRLQELVPMIIGAVFPGDEDVTPDVLRGWLGELEAVGLIHRYEVDGEHYIQCHDWDDHQKISHPSKSVLPPWDGDSGSLPEDSRNAPGRLPEDSGGEGKGREGEKEGKGVHTRTRDRRLLPDHLHPVAQALDRVAFDRDLPPPEPAAIARICEQLPDRDHILAAEKFVGYFLDGRGENARMGSVTERFEKWLREEPSAAKARSGAGGPRSSADADIARLEAEKERLRAEEEAGEVAA